MKKCPFVKIKKTQLKSTNDACCLDELWEDRKDSIMWQLRGKIVIVDSYNNRGKTVDIAEIDDNGERGEEWRFHMDDVIPSYEFTGKDKKFVDEQNAKIKEWAEELKKEKAEKLEF